MPIKQPNAYVHPKRRRKVEPSSDQPEPAPVRKKSQTSTTPKTGHDKTEQFRLVLYPPVSGEVPVYDAMLKAGFPANRALLGLLKKNFDAFEANLLAGKITSAAEELKTQGNPVATMRNVSPLFIEEARKTFDPFDVLSGRALGRRVAEHILRSMTD